MPASLAEIFSSIQGEGIYAGVKQVFLRLTGCNLACGYCDTPLPQVVPRCRVERSPGRRDYEYYDNPLDEDTVSRIVHSYGLPLHHSVSFTGGEPLLHPETIRALVPLLRGARRGIYLETNGTRPDELAAVIGLVDIVAMDIKLPSVTGMPPRWEEHSRFLAVASRKEVFVKIVVGEETTEQEIITAARLVETAGADIPLVIQPVTRAGGKLGITPGRLLDFQRIALQKLVDVRVIPQTHKTTGQL
ncbi:MAG: 7-carboxy-7-deazaguanine synthase QueE [Firmicutes bacterium]|nr:7-carboxy-7-deazaguanine synthase QueE [Bacillota bacterium]